MRLQIRLSLLLALILANLALNCMLPTANKLSTSSNFEADCKVNFSRPALKRYALVAIESQAQLSRLRLARQDERLNLQGIR